MEDEEALREKLAELREEHRDMDSAIDRLVEMSVVDALKLQRLRRESCN